MFRQSMIFLSIILVCIALTVASGFVVPECQLRWLSTRFSQSENTKLKGWDKNGDENNDWEEVRRRDIEEFYAQRNLPIETEGPNLFVAWRDTFLKATFFRLDPSKLRTIIFSQRSYGRYEPFCAKNIRNPPVVDDLLPEPTKVSDSFYLSVPAIVLTFFVTFAVFPTIAGFLVIFVDIPPQMLSEITSKLGPGISILFGTFVSLTLSILYNRQRNVQDGVAKEASMLSLLLHQMVSLFRNDRSRMVRAAQCAADQVRILLRESRGVEYMTMIYTDPYVRMLELIEEEEERLVRDHGDFLAKGPVLNSCRDIVKDLRKFRAGRLSDEALALPPTHFFILQVLNSLLLSSYVVSVLPAVEELGYTPIESSIIFGILSTVYLVFYSFATDLNDLYQGVFQIRRGSSVSHLLEVKKIVSDHPWLRFDVNFERVNKEVMRFYPGLAEVWFENESFS